MYTLLTDEPSFLLVRMLLSLSSAFIIIFLFGNKFIVFLHSLQKNGQPISKYLDEEHQRKKKNTPTMGGVLILFATSISILIFGNLKNPNLLLTLIFMLSFSVIGFIDDYTKLTQNSNKGIKGKVKLLSQAFLSSIYIYITYNINKDSFDLSIQINQFTSFSIYIGILYFLFALIVIIGSSNAVNLTDGLDGLVSMPIIFAMTSFAIVTYLVGDLEYANMLNLTHVEDSRELIILYASIIGAQLGFLWFNAPPAKMFMGDTGSLSIGATLGMVAVTLHQEIFLFLVGGLFVIEALSAIIQISSSKLFNKKVFLMAPIHHHFEKKNWSEPTIVIRFWIIAMILSFFSIFSLFIR